MKVSDAYKTTIVSIFPQEINEVKPGLFPGRYKLLASKDGKPTCTIISEATHYVYLDVDRGHMPVRNPSIQVAESIVHDFINSCMEISEDAYPGLFCVPGVHTPESVEKEFTTELKMATTAQTNWYKNLVALANKDWSEFHKYNVVSGIQKLAAKALGIKKDWTEISEARLQIACKFCLATIDTECVVCPNCHEVVNAERFEAIKNGAPVISRPAPASVFSESKEVVAEVEDDLKELRT